MGKHWQITRPVWRSVRQNPEGYLQHGYGFTGHRASTDKAVEMFTQIVTQYADSEQADKARQQLAELVPDNQQAAVPGQSIISRRDCGG